MYCMIQFIKLANANYFMTKFYQWLLSMDREMGWEELQSGIRKHLGYECIYYLDCGDGFKDAYMSNFNKFYTLSICNLCVHYNSIKLF